MSMKSLVIIPTYNECENVEAITGAVLKVASDPVHVLVVDDSSPDGTGEIVRRLMKERAERFPVESSPRLHLLSRRGKEGLGRAYIAAFQWGLKRGYDAFVEMDADFSHRPEDLLKLLEALSQVDFAVGSRYVTNGRTLNWGVSRKIISRGGSWYARVILGYPLSDWTGGFNAWKRHVLEAIDLERIRSEGYSFQIELKYRSLQKGFRSQEVPIVFEDRRVGKSKMSLKIVLEAFVRVWFMRFG